MVFRVFIRLVFIMMFLLGIFFFPVGCFYIQLVNFLGVGFIDVPLPMLDGSIPDT